MTQGSDLQGVKAYSQVDTEGVHTLGTVVVDYRGYRVTAQSIIPGKSPPALAQRSTPGKLCCTELLWYTSSEGWIFIFCHSFVTGILEREQEQSVVYGSIDFGKTVVPNDKYKELVRAVTSAKCCMILICESYGNATLLAH